MADWRRLRLGLRLGLILVGNVAVVFIIIVLPLLKVGYVLLRQQRLLVANGVSIGSARSCTCRALHQRNNRRSSLWDHSLVIVIN